MGLRKGTHSKSILLLKINFKKFPNAMTVLNRKDFFEAVDSSGNSSKWVVITHN